MAVLINFNKLWRSILEAGLSNVDWLLRSGVIPEERSC